MNKYVKEFLHRGLLFGGFGPVVCAIVFAILDWTDVSISLTGSDILIAVISTYLLAFIQAGASVFNQIESWPITKSLLCHFSVLFFAYSGCYLLNSWIPFEPMVLLIFCIIFVAVYFIIWITGSLLVRAHTKKLNARLT